MIYSYTGLDRQGVEQKGQIEAESEKDVVRLLRERSIFVLQITEGVVLGDEGGALAAVKKYLLFLSPRHYAPVGSTDLVNFFRQLALMLQAGYTLVTALDACYEMVPRYRLRRCIGRMSDEIRRGATFSSMLAAEKHIFNPMFANLVASGEQSGNLDSILERLADSIEKSRDLKRQLVSALVYPSFVLLASIGVTIFLVLGVIPRFGKFLRARGSELPQSTEMLLGISDFAVDYGKIIGIGLAVAIFLILAAYTFTPGKRLIDRIILIVPVIGKAVLFAGMAQAGWCLSMLLKSGVTALESLRITSGVLGNLAIADNFRDAADDLLEGKALSRAFEKGHITVMMQHMAAVGESSGQLDTVMSTVGEYYRKELAARVSFIASMIEPMLILGVGGVVGFVYYAFFQAVLAVSSGG